MANSGKDRLLRFLNGIGLVLLVLISLISVLAQGGHGKTWYFLHNLFIGGTMWGVLGYISWLTLTTLGITVPLWLIIVYGIIVAYCVVESAYNHANPMDPCVGGRCQRFRSCTECPHREAYLFDLKMVGKDNLTDPEAIMGKWYDEHA